MPRKFQLTWQAGSNGRDGRWRKKYKGRIYYFNSGRGKYDQEAYKAAIKEWEEIKFRVDREQPRKHLQDFERAIDEWEQVLAWSNRHGDQQMAARAYEKLDSLKTRIAAPVLKPLKNDDWFADQFTLPTIEIADDQLQRAKDDLAAGNLKFKFSSPFPSQEPIDVVNSWYTDPLQVSKEVWSDRLKQQHRRTALGDDSLECQSNAYSRQKQQQADSGQLSVGRAYSVRLHLTYFQDWAGKDTSVSEIDGSLLLKYQSHLLDNVSQKGWTRTTANHYLKTLKAFMRWLWQTEIISTLPRVLDGKAGPLRINVNPPAVVVFTLEEISTLLNTATDRTKLYILLMLNCGMTQKDISDLQTTEVDWIEGRIIRKRSKTSQFDNVPKVSYLLWNATFRLLQQERSKNEEGRVLVNVNGAPLLTETLEENGKLKKTDNIKNAFDRLRNRLEITKPLKSFKKTSASLLRDSERFQSLEDLFLGHAPEKLSDKHYTKVPTNLLDTAVSWLEEQYGLV
ncbi:tyrosine-type recombinase/integrase [Rubinisphaera margarita]|uniref:tyrosine-type recombinase/integrase n=1 Tax=Rubinisphaera margarita TaxID=2909586 RepID=UPI001EE8F63E|nr:phage integrase SAM-like domain-containing protein [Rubinisphaera margarita]MCG6156366.1 phage integrase SAM-like domain-containing protein [Rubinisphaera margarita]